MQNFIIFSTTFTSVEVQNQGLVGNALCTYLHPSPYPYLQTQRSNLSDRRYPGQRLDPSIDPWIYGLYGHNTKEQPIRQAPGGQFWFACVLGSKMTRDSKLKFYRKSSCIYINAYQAAGLSRSASLQGAQSR